MHDIVVPLTIVFFLSLAVSTWKHNLTLPMLDFLALLSQNPLSNVESLVNVLKLAEAVLRYFRYFLDPAG